MTQAKTLHANAGMGKRKKLVTLCLHCQRQERETPADFVHLRWYPGTDLGPIGFCWDCYNRAAAELLASFKRIATLSARIDVLYAQLPEEERRNIRPARR